jgi:hypothetical protein
LLLPLAWLTGCRNQAAQDLLERDLRYQEDRIYELEAKLEMQCDLVEALRRENDALRVAKPADAEKPTSSSRQGNGKWQPRGGNVQDLVPPSISLPDAPPFDGPPEIRSPNKKFPEGEPPRSDAPKFEAPLKNSGTPGGEGPRLGSAEVMSITLDEQRSHGYDNDGLPGDDGVSVVVEPRSVDGQLVNSPGPISIVLMDPTLSGPAARLARWDFTADEVTRRWTHQAASDAQTAADGYLFSMRWVGQPPRNRNLALHVRYQTSDGRKLDASLPIEIEPPGNAPAASAPRSRQWAHRQAPHATHGTPRSSQAGSGDAPMVILEPPPTPSTGPSVAPRAAESPAARTADRIDRARGGWSPYR